MALTFGCGSDARAPNFMPGLHELFFDVNVESEACDENVFTTALSLSSSEFAETAPNEIQVLHWDFLEDVWTDVDTLTATVDGAQEYTLDMERFGGCDSLGSSLVFVPRSNNAYGSPNFVTLNRGLANGASSSYSFETRTNTVKLFCPHDAIDAAEASVYNFKRRRADASVELSVLMDNDDSFLSRDEWMGTTGMLEADEDVVIFIGKKEGVLVCSFLL